MDTESIKQETLVELKNIFSKEFEPFQAVRSIIHFMRANAPHPLWDCIEEEKEYPELVAEDIEEFTQWLETVLHQNPLNEKTVGLFVGLNERLYFGEDKEVLRTPGIDLSGADHFYEEDEDCEWAADCDYCSESSIWLFFLTEMYELCEQLRGKEKKDDSKYVEIETTISLDGILRGRKGTDAEDSDVGWLGQHVFCWAYACIVAMYVLKHVDQNLLFNHQEALEIACGWKEDTGSYLGRISKTK